MTNVLRKRENARLRLDEILEAIGYLYEDLEGHTVETLGSDRRARQLAERNLEIIYEGQKSLLDEEKTAEQGVVGCEFLFDASKRVKTGIRTPQVRTH